MKFFFNQGRFSRLDIRRRASGEIRVSWRRLLRDLSDWPYCRLVCGLALVLCAPGSSLGAAAGLSLAESSSRATQWAIDYEGKRLMVYAFDSQQFKPYVKALNTVEGYGVLRDAPSDHLHHHALMYGITVNGINFWEETAGCGVEKVVESPPPVIEQTPEGRPRARLTQLLYWVAPQDAFLPNSDAPSLLIERRTLVLTMDPAKRETALYWRSAFEVGTKTNVVTLSGANYHGLGMRFLNELDPVAVHLAPEGRLDLANNRQDVSPHSWEAVIFERPGKPATIALFGAGTNARGDAHYFAMKTPFAYLAATQNLDREPLVYHRGERFELNFLVTLYPEKKTAEALAERSRQWGADSRP
jgi:hypothetical protein